MYGVLADLVVLLHFGFVIFALLGGLLVLRWRWIAWLHIPAAVWASGIEFGGWVCPLTWLENWLITLADGVPDQGDFVQRYIVPVLYPEGLTRGMQLALGFIVIIVNLCVYGIFLHRAGRNSGGRK